MSAPTAMAQMAKKSNAATLRRVDSKLSDGDAAPLASKSARDAKPAAVAQFLLDHRQLQRDAQQIERESMQLLQRALPPDLHADFQQVAKQHAERRQAQAARLRAQLHALARLGGLFTKRTATLGTTTAPDQLDVLKRSMEATERCTSQIRQHLRTCHVEDLDDERRLTHEVHLLAETLLRAPAPASRPGTAPTGPADATAASSKRPAAVLEFEEFVATNGGHYGGWDEPDHVAFVRLHRKLAGPPPARATLEQTAQLAVQLVIRDAVAVQEHCRWFETYCELQQRQRDAIVAWRQQQRSRAAAAVPATAIDNSETTAPPRASNTDREATRIAVESWKKTKAEKLAARAAADAKVAQAAERADSDRRKERTSALHARAAAARAQRASAAVRETVAAHAEAVRAADRARAANKAASLTLARDAQLASVRAAQIAQAHARRAATRQQQLAAVPTRPVVPPSDPDRLHRATAAQRARAPEVSNATEQSRAERAREAFTVPRLPRR